MNYEEAKKAVLQRLESRHVGKPGELMIVDAATIKKPYGWIVFYNSRAFVETAAIEHALIGNGPVIVVSKTGVIIEAGSADPVDETIAHIEEHYQLLSQG